MRHESSSFLRLVRQVVIRHGESSESLNASPASSRVHWGQGVFTKGLPILGHQDQMLSWKQPKFLNTTKGT